MDYDKELLKIINDSWAYDLRQPEIDTDTQTDYECEYGSSNPVGISKVTAYNAEGEEIEIPKCKKCGVHMCQVMGKESCAWMCLMGCDNG